MKRLFILSAAVAALASCSNSEVITEVNEPQVPDKAIAFETFSSNATRGAGDPSENSGQTETDGLEGHHNNFQVWGYKDVQPSYVFNGVTVSYTEGQTGSWNYSPIHFWDKNANSYEFYACAPATSSFTLNRQETISATQANDYFTLSEVTLHNVTSSKTEYVQSLKNYQVSNIVNESGETTSTSITYGGPKANTDYMIANACKVENTNFGDPVQLHFNHILSRLNITVKKGTGLQGSGIKVKLNSLTVNKLVANGKFNESAVSENLASGTNNRWTHDNPSYVSYVANPLVKENDAAQGGQDNSNLVESAEKYVLQSLVMPQEVTYESVKRDGSDNESEPYLQLVYTIVNDSYEETFKAFFNLAAAFGADATNNTTIAFNEGWQNTLHITIDATQITFDPDVYRWMDKENKDFNAESGTSSDHPTNP